MKLKINKILIIIFFTIFAFFLFEINQENYADEILIEEKFDKEISGIAKVVDGDTIHIGEKRIRLLFIDAAESKQECFNEKNEKYFCGIMAKEFLKNFAENKNIICKYAKKDIYKRFLAECFLNDISINKLMLQEGMAVIYSFDKVGEELKILQENAKERKIGIWKGSFETPKNYRKRMKKYKAK